jgi:hypothetical protein
MSRHRGEGTDRSRTGNTTTRRPLQFTPDRDDLVDAGALFALGLVALLEFHTTFAGWNFLAVGAIGIFLGLVISHIANVLRQPAIVLIAMGIAVFFLLGGAVALRDAPGASVVPTTGTLRGLVNGSVHGWRNLLTTVPPVDGTGPLLVLPYMLGLFLGLGGFALARRLRAAFWPLLAPVLVLVAVIIMGSLAPTATVLTATVFAGMSLYWVKDRDQRLHPVSSSGSGRLTRGATTAALFAVAASGAYFIGPNVVGAHSQDRVVLRKYIIPPFNLGDYPSPLGEFRLYVQNRKVGSETVGLKNKNLFTVTGSLPAGSAIAFATLDSYNGTVWAVTNQAAVVSGKLNSFLRVGRQLDNPSSGPRYTMQVTVDSYSDYWLPTAGAVQKVSFAGTDATQHAADFRYNLATGTGIVPAKLTQGDSYTLTVAGVTRRTLTEHDSLSGGADTASSSFLNDTALALAGTQGDLTSQVLTMARNLKSQGRFTIGDASSGFEYYLPGHSTGRLTDFVKGVIPGVKYVGDDEQFAAAFALMIEQLGVPARVVIGVESLPASRVVQGHDVTAWVQVRAADGAWLTIPRSSFVSTARPDKRQIQQVTQPNGGSNVPPPAQGRPKSPLDDTAASDSSFHNQTAVAKSKHSGFHLPGWVIATLRIVGPLVLIVAFGVGVITGVKAWRRRLRRTRGSPATRLAHGWVEVIDHARDLGNPTSGPATRREQAIELTALQLGPLAVLTDRHVFGPDPITEAAAEEFWSHVHAERKRMSGTVSRRRRLWAAVNVTTLLPAALRAGLRAAARPQQPAVRAEMV